MLEQETNGTSNPSNSNSLESAPTLSQSGMQLDANGSHIEKSHEEVKEENDQPNGNPADDKKEDYFAVFLKNIPFTATEDDVRKHFEKTCEVKKVAFVVDNGKFRGRATVELTDRKSFKEAKKLIGSQMDGRPLYVVPHRSMKSDPDSEEEEKKIYKVIVSNIPDSVSVLEAKRHFYSAGLIRRFLVKKRDSTGRRDSSRHDGTAILKVDKLDAFVNVMKLDGSILGGAPIKVEPWAGSDADEPSSFKRVADSGEFHRENPKKRQKSREEIQRAELENSLSLFVGNLPYIVSKEEIIKHFEQAGPVKDCKIPVIATPKIRRPVAFVRMCDKEGHEKALKLLGSTIGDCEIHVDAIRDYNRMSKWVFCDKPPKKGKDDFVAFVGNIPYTTTKESIQKHFEDVGEIKSIDIPVKNGLQRGMAYVKLGDQAAFEKALDKHHTTLEGRIVDVLDASRGDNLYDLPTQSRRRPRGRFFRHGRRGIHELTWHSLCRP